MSMRTPEAKKKLYELNKLSLNDSLKEWRKRAFESELENMYDMKSLNDINCIHLNKVNNIAEWNLLHVILNTSKLTKNINIYYNPILNVCMNKCRGKAKFNIIWILLDIGCNYTIVIISLIKKHKTKEDAVIQCHTQAVVLTLIWVSK